MHPGVLPQHGQERLGVAEPGPGERLDLGPVEGEQLQLPGVGDRRAVVADDPRRQKHPAMWKPPGEGAEPLAQALAAVGFVGDRLPGFRDLDGDLVPGVQEHDRVAGLEPLEDEAVEGLGPPRSRPGGQGLLQGIVGLVEVGEPGQQRQGQRVQPAGAVAQDPGAIVGQASGLVAEQPGLAEAGVTQNNGAGKAGGGMLVPGDRRRRSRGGVAVVLQIQSFFRAGAPGA